MSKGQIQIKSDNASAFARAARALMSSKICIAACVFTLLLAIACFAAPLIAPYEYETQNLAMATKAPCAEYLLGTDTLGRDILSRILYGGRVSFAVGILATFVSIAIGVCYGMISGMAGGKIDAFLMRVVDIIYSLPFTIFVILLMIAFGRSLWLIFIAIGAVEWLTMARITRAMTMDLKSRQFVEVSQSLGQTNFAIMRKHILPNLLGAILVCAALTVPSVMLLESFLSFLGLGVQAPLPSWGSMVKDGAECMEDAPWMLIYPALAFSSTLYCLNKIGETLSEEFSK